MRVPPGFKDRSVIHAAGKPKYRPAYFCAPSFPVSFSSVSLYIYAASLFGCSLLVATHTRFFSRASLTNDMARDELSRHRCGQNAYTSRTAGARILFLYHGWRTRVAPETLARIASYSVSPSRLLIHADALPCTVHLDPRATLSNFAAAIFFCQSLGWTDDVFATSDGQDLDRLELSWTVLFLFGGITAQEESEFGIGNVDMEAWKRLDC